MCRRLLRTAIGIDWRREIIVERSLEEPIHIIEPRLDVRIARATEDDLYMFRGIIDERKLAVVRERFKKGVVCQAAFTGDRIVGFNWANLYEYEEDCETKGKLPEGEAYMFDGYTSPEYRQSKIGAAVATQLLSFLQSEGYRRAHGVIPATNIPARTAWGSVGWRGKRAVTVITVFGWKVRHWRKFTDAL